MTRLLTLAARLSGRVWFWYWDEAGKRHLWFGRIES